MDSNSGMEPEEDDFFFCQMMILSLKVGMETCQMNWYNLCIKNDLKSVCFLVFKIIPLFIMAAFGYRDNSTFNYRKTYIRV